MNALCEGSLKEEEDECESEEEARYSEEEEEDSFDSDLLEKESCQGEQEGEFDLEDYLKFKAEEENRAQQAHAAISNGTLQKEGDKRPKAE